MPPRSTVAASRAPVAAPKKAAGPIEVTTGRGAGFRNVVKRASEQAGRVKQQGGQISSTTTTPKQKAPGGAASSRPKSSNVPIAGTTTSARRKRDEDSHSQQSELDEIGAFDDVGGGYSPPQGSSKPQPAGDRDILDSHLSSSSQPGVNKEEILAKQLDGIQADSLRAFSQFILNRFAKKSLEDIAGSLARALEARVLQKVAEALWKLLDAQNKGRIGLAEYTLGMHSIGFPGSQPQRIFFLLDDRNKGSLWRYEFVDKLEAWMHRAAKDLKKEDAKRDELQSAVPKERGVGYVNYVPSELNNSTIDLAMLELGKMYAAGKNMEAAQLLVLSEYRQLQEVNAALRKQAFELQDETKATRESERRTIEIRDEAVRDRDLIQRTLDEERAEREEEHVKRQAERSDYERRLMGLEAKVSESEQRCREKEDSTSENATLQEKLNELQKRLDDQTMLLCEESRRREESDNAGTAREAKLKVLEEMLRKSIGKERYLMAHNKSLEDSLIETSTLLRDVEESVLRSKSDALDASTKYTDGINQPDVPVSDAELRWQCHALRKMVRLDGFLPRSVCMKASRYPMNLEETFVTPMSSRLP